MEKMEDENDESWLYGNSEQKVGDKSDNAELTESAIIEDNSNVAEGLHPDGDDVQFVSGTHTAVNARLTVSFFL